jgi:REP element-mobilizing transposase RayT
VGRALREDTVGATTHVTARGNNKQPVHLDELDFQLFQDRVARVTRRYGFVVLAYCLMTNHCHFLVELPQGGLSEGMQVALGEYARVANRRHGRTGHLWQARFRTTPIVDEAHLLRTARYIVLNPVRAGICASPEEWRWSSYRACAGLALPEPFLALGQFLRYFGTSPEKAHEEYRRFVASGHVRVSDTRG